MIAIYKKELRTLFNSLSGSIAVAVMLLVTGLMFRYYNLYNGALTLHYTVSNSTLLFYIVIPVLTMRVFAEEKKQKTDQLLITAPVSLPEIVLGKYLALVTVFAVPILVMCIYPLIMTRFGAETLRWDYACILMFFLMGCAYLAVGMFISSTTESPVIAAILCIVFIFATQMLSSIFTIIGASGISSLIFLIVLMALAGLLTFYMTRNYYLSLGTFAVLTILFLILFRVRPEWFSGRTESVLRVLDFYTHFQDIAAGSFGISNVVYYVSFAIAGVILTIALDSRRLVHGIWTLALTAILLTGLVVINFIVSMLPSGIATYDLTEQGLFSLTDASKEYLAALDRDVTLYFLTENGQEDEGLEKLLDEYQDASSHIQVERVDAVVNPAFAKKYTDDQVSLNSVIAVSGESVSVADYQNFYQYSMSGMSYTAGAYDAEGQITGAIADAVRARNVKVCYTTGHDEVPLGPELTEAMEKEHIESVPINLLSETIPADCTALIVFAPQQDLTQEEANKVLKYLYAGGHALLVSMPYLVSGAETPNYDSILGAYGIEREEGLVMEGDDTRFVQAPYLILPTVSIHSEVTRNLVNQNMICSLSEALHVREDDDMAWSVTSLLSTSHEAYLKTDIDTTLEKTEGDASGEFVLGVQVEQTFSKDNYGQSDIPEGNVQEEEEAEAPKATKMLCFTTPCTLSSDALSSLIQQATGLPEGNTSLISEALAYLTDEESGISVPAKVLVTPQTTIDTGTVNLLGGLMMLLLPALVMAGGAAVFVVRRRR